MSKWPIFKVSDVESYRPLMQPVLKVAGIANERCQSDQYWLRLFFNDLILKVSVLKNKWSWKVADTKNYRYQRAWEIDKMYNRRNLRLFFTFTVGQKLNRQKTRVLKLVPWESFSPETFFSWSQIFWYLRMSQSLQKIIQKSFKIILNQESLSKTCWLEDSSLKNEKWRADSLKSLVQRNVQMTGALTEGVSTLLWI